MNALKIYLVLNGDTIGVLIAILIVDDGFGHEVCFKCDEMNDQYNENESDNSEESQESLHSVSSSFSFESMKFVVDDDDKEMREALRIRKRYLSSFYTESTRLLKKTTRIKLLTYYPQNFPYEIAKLVGEKLNVRACCNCAKLVPLERCEICYFENCAECSVNFCKSGECGNDRRDFCKACLYSTSCFEDDIWSCSLCHLV